MAEKKEKQYVSDNAQLMAEWNWEKNVDIDPSQLTLGSGKKVWWKCQKGHEWLAIIGGRSKGSGCPFCSGQRAIRGENDLATINPSLSSEWNYEKNNGLTPSDVMANSGKKVWWKCCKGHEWQTTIDHRNKGSGCPFCSGRNAIKGETDLQTVNPTLAKEWNYEKNGNLKPEEFTAYSEKKVWWKCQKGHEWYSAIYNRNKGGGCPYCSGRYAIKGETDLQTVNSTLAKEWNYEKNGELSPMDVLPSSNKKIWWKCEKGHEWQTTIDHRNKGSGCPYCARRYALKGENDLLTANPTLAKEWNYEKNGELSPMDVLPSSNKKVWWKCQKGHEWLAIIGNRNNGNGCPICSSERNTSLAEYTLLYYLKKHNVDVLHSYKEQGYELDIYIPLLKTAIEYDGYYWHKNKAKKDLEKNQNCKKDGIKLYRIREGLPSLNDSSIDYIIKKTQDDLSQVLNKILSEILEANINVNLKRDAIEIENLREYTEKENSLLFSNPTLASEWNYKKNNRLKPEHFLANSNKTVWWKCQKGHEWQATITSRNNGTGCPYCSSNKLLKGYNDLQTLNTNLAKEWNYDKNDGLTPMDVMPNSNKKAWWKCQKGHEWQASIINRNKGRKCPFCSNKQVLKGYNDLLTVNPILASEWNYDKNEKLLPTDVMPNSGKKVWWKCSKGHEWQANVHSRNSGCGCPYCSGQKVIKGKNDLQTINPSLASEWNYEKNSILTPFDVMPNSGKKVWWMCQKGHEWQASIINRNRGNGCPYCSGRKK